MTDINTWNPTDDSNNAAAPAGWPEGMMPSGVNNSARAMMGALKRWRDQSQPTVIATGSGNAQIITYPVAPAALAMGDTFTFFALGNTGPATLQVNAQAAKPVVTSGNTALIGGEIPPGGAVISVVYDNTSFRMLAAPTPLSISNGGTGQTTPAAAADAIGAVKDTGDTMTGPLTVPYIVYSADPAHSFRFGWDGLATHVYVDGIDQGVIGDISGVSAGNGLTGGGTSGALSLAMSGSYSGNFGATGTVSGATLSSSGNISASAQVSGNTVVGNGITSNGNLSVADQITCRHLYSSGDQALGSWIFYTSDQVHINTNVWPVDGAHYCGLAASAWAGVEAYAFITKSDPALKRDIEPVPPGCLGLVEAITPKTYKLNLEADEGRTHWGFLAPEVGEAMQRAGFRFDGVRAEGDAPSSLAYNELIAVLWGAVQELSARVEALTR